MNSIRLYLLGILFLMSVPVAARDISDDVMDVEEITADTEGAKRAARVEEKRAAIERQENQDELRKAKEAKMEAYRKRNEAALTIKKTETELLQLAAEKNRLQQEALRIGHDIMVSEQTIAEAKAKLEKARADNQALLAARDAKQNQMIQMIREGAALEDSLTVQMRELERNIAEEKTAVAELEKTRADEAARKVSLEARVNALKGQFRELREQRKALGAEVRKTRAFNQRLDEQVKAGEGEISAVQAGLPADRGSEN